VARVILDTTVLIGVERSRSGLDRLLSDEDDVAIAAVTAAELLVGVALADEAHRAHRSAFVASVLDTVPVEDYDLAVARAHADLMVHVRRSGRARGAHDLLIAATARARDRMVVTAEAAGFADLPGVPVRSPLP
jgi:tRNA(fMet)-specific endonuclease VapC